MPRYLYAWTVRPAPNVEIELRIRAAAAVHARRELRRFLETRLEGDWSVCSVTRSLADGPRTSQESSFAMICAEGSGCAESAGHSL